MHSGYWPASEVQGGSYETNKWQHLALVFDGVDQTVTSYNNGFEVVTESVTSTDFQLQAVPLIIGNNRQNNLQQSPGVNGEIDGVRLMAHARSHRNVCKSAFGSSCSGAIAYHPTSSQYEISMQIKDIFFLFSNCMRLPSFAPQTCTVTFLNQFLISRLSATPTLMSLQGVYCCQHAHTGLLLGAAQGLCQPRCHARRSGQSDWPTFGCFWMFLFFALIFFVAFLRFRVFLHVIYHK